MERFSLSLRVTAGVAGCVLLLGACSAPPSDREAATDQPQASPVAQKDQGAEVLGTRRYHRTRVAVIGDFGMATPAEHWVSKRIKAWAEANRIHALGTTGDNIYPAGHPDSFQAAWHEPYGWVDRKGLLKVASLGNHDHGTDDGRPVMELLDMPRRRYKQHLRYVDIFVLDSNLSGSDDQKDWLRRGLNDSNARWQVVLFHHPPFSCGEHGSDLAARAAFNRILKRKGADLVLNGHEHSYQRFKETGGVTYVVTGGGGAMLYTLGACPADTPKRIVKNDDNYHYVRLIVSGSRLKVRAVTAGGRILDRFGLTH